MTDISPCASRAGRGARPLCAALLALLAATGCGGPDADSAPSPESAAEVHHDDEQHGDVVHLTDDDARAAGIELATAEVAALGETLSLPAEVRFDPDRIANVASPVGGVIRQLDVTEGDVVEAGQTLAVLSSRELADLKAEFLTAQSTEDLVRIELGRSEELSARNISSQAQLQTARAELASAAAAREAAETKLHALGLDHDVLDVMLDAEDGSLSLFPLVAPIAGQVVRRAATLGQNVETGGGAMEPMFVIADASTVWVDVAVFKNDLARIVLGAGVALTDDRGAPLADGVVSYIAPVIDETSRTATARVVIDNADGRLRPGQFVAARIEVDDSVAGVRVPEAAVQTVEGRDAVFVPVAEGFETRAIVVGRRAGGHVEIASGLEPGERYVAVGAFTLRAELETSAFGDGHAH